jgi:hypothetical protein
MSYTKLSPITVNASISAFKSAIVDDSCKLDWPSPSPLPKIRRRPINGLVKQFSQVHHKILLGPEKGS